MISGRVGIYPRVLQIIQQELYLTEADISIIRRKRQTEAVVAAVVEEEEEEEEDEFEEESFSNLDRQLATAQSLDEDLVWVTDDGAPDTPHWRVKRQAWFDSIFFYYNFLVNVHSSTKVARHTRRQHNAQQHVRIPTTPIP